MKYSNYYRGLMMISLFFMGCAVEAYYEFMPQLCAVFCVLSFILWFGGIMAPNNEKYTQEYYEKRKGI
jgi:hypothetical protein